MPPEVTINLVFEKDVDAEKLRVLATVLREPEKILDPFTMSISEPSAIESLCQAAKFGATWVSVIACYWFTRGRGISD